MKKHRKIITFLLALIMMVLVPLTPLTQGFTVYAASSKIFDISPSRIDSGETVTIKVLLQYTQKADVYVEDSSGSKLKIIANNVTIGGYDGTYRIEDGEIVVIGDGIPENPNVFSWNGKDSSGNDVESGRYTIVVMPDEELFKKYADRGSVNVGSGVIGGGSDELFVDPNISSGKFRFHGYLETGEEDESQGIDESDYKKRVYIETEKVELTVEGETQEASKNGEKWEVTLDDPITPYKIVEVTGEKLNKITIEEEFLVAKEVPDGTDEEGNTIYKTVYEWEDETSYEEETIVLQSINIADHVTRELDLISYISVIYFNSILDIANIRNDNDKDSSWNPKEGDHVLVLEPLGIYYDVDSTTYEKLEAIVNIYSTICTEDPVDIMSGNYIYNHIDIEITGGFPIEFSRWYNSRDNYNGLLGRNWHTSFEYRLWEKSNEIEVVFPDGRRIKYNYSGGKYTPAEAGEYDKLEKINGKFVLTKKDKTQYTFDDAGSISEIKDSNGNITKFVYRGDFLAEIRTDSGYLIIDYTNKGLIRQIRDNTGRVVKYGYNSNNELTQFTYANGESILYDYDGSSRLTTVESPDRSASVSNQYDNQGRVELQKFPDGSIMLLEYDTANNKTIVTERNGQITTYYYDDQYRVTQVDHEDGTEFYSYNGQNELENYTDKSGSTTAYQYDERGNVVQINKDGELTHLVYDDNNKVTSFTDPKGSTQSYSYDDKGNLLTETDSNGNITFYSYNSKGQVELVTKSNGSTTKFQYDNNGNISKVTDGRGNTIGYQYDSLNRVISVTDREGITTELEYNSEDKIAKIIYPDETFIEYEYDKNGQVVKYTDQNEYSESYEYDKAGRITKLIDVMGYETTYQYDDMGNLLNETDKRGNTTTYTYDQYNNLKSKTDPEGNITQYEYDNNSNLTKEIDPRGKATTYEYDIKGNLTKITDPYENVVSYEYDELGKAEKITDKKGNIISYTYDPTGNIVEQIDKNNNPIVYEYDSLGRLTKRIDQLERIEELIYDKEGNLTAVIDALGHRQNYEYDGESRVTSITDKRGAITKYTYDELGRLTKIKNALNGEKNLEYDKLGNIISIEDERGNTTAFNYDKAGNLIEEEDPYGRITTYTYDENSNLTKVTDPKGYTLLYTYDKNNRVIEVKDKENNTTSYTYDKAGNIATVTDPLGRITGLEYDNLNRLAKVTDKDGLTIRYIYDEEDNITSVTDKIGNTLYYEYDPIGNIIKETNERGYDTKYIYDPVGNLIEKIDPKENSVKIDYDLLGRTKKVTDEEGNTTRYSYDEAGNITQITDALGNTTGFAYDLLGRVTSKTDRDGNTTKYTYDEVGSITQETNARGYVSEFKYDKNGNLIKEIGPNGNITEYEYDSIGRMTDLINPDGTTKSFTYDKEDRIKTVTDEKGNTTKYTYDAVGNLVKTTDALGNEAYYTYDEMDRLVEVKVINQIQKITSDMGLLTVAETVYGSGELESLTTEENTLTVNEEVYRNLASTEDEITVSDEVYGLLQSEIEMETTIEEQITIYQYDARGLMKKVIDPRGDRESYTYDEAGNMIIKIDKEGNETQYQYDELNLIKQINYNDGETVLFEYDKTGKLVTATEEIGVSEFEYDPVGRLTKHVDHRGNITKYTWTKEGLKESIEYPDQEKVRYNYDEVGNLQQVTVAHGKITKYKYDPANRLLEEILPNQIKTKYTYDEMNRLTNLVQTNVDGTLIDEYGYEYDEAGNTIKKSQYGEYTREYAYDKLERLTEIKVGDKTLKYNYDSIGNRRQQYETAGEYIQNLLDYEYDIANRLTKFDNEKYKYDKNGNLIETKTDNKITNKYQYDDKNRLIYSKNKHNDAQNYTYDFMGNRVQVEMDIDTNAGGNRPDPKDKNNEKKGNNGKGIGVGQIPPGHAKREIDENNDGTTNGGNPKPGWGHQYNRTAYRVEYTYDITSPYQNILMQYGEHYQTQKYTYGVGRISIDFIELDDNNNGWIPKTAPTRLEEEYQRLYYLEDELGSTKRLISEQGKVSVSYKYYDFGTPSTTTHFDVNWSGPDNLMGYTGYEWDNIAEMWYAKARYYDSDLGRFAAQDPIKGNISDIQSLNLYPYVKNNPLKYIDPMGLSPFGYGTNLSQEVREIINSSKPKANKPKTEENEQDWTGCEVAYKEGDNILMFANNGQAFKATVKAVHDRNGVKHLVPFPDELEDFGRASKVQISSKELASIAIGITPLDAVKDVIDLIAGEDVITGQKLNRWIMAGMIITPEIVDVAIKQGAKNGDEILDFLKANNGTVKPVSTMGEFFSDGFGKSIKKNLSKTKLQYDGQSIYKVTNKTGNDYLKKGYGVYLDALHKDHLEVIDKAGKVKYVLNLDGTLNADKTAKAIGRTIKGW